MNRIDRLFSEKKKDILSIFFTAGFPELTDTMRLLKALEANGTDMIELGMPYSDPLADGPVIQRSSQVAIQNGMSISLLFDQIKNMRDEINIPVILMGYLNPVLQFGFENFCAAASGCGIDGIILPDLPMHEFETTCKSIVDKYKLHFIFLVTPETKPDRLKKIDELGSGFIYAVSSSSTTGQAKSTPDNVDYFRKLHDAELKHPFLVGFGINNKESFNNACRYAPGAIIGSAYINAIQSGNNIETATKDFVKGVLG